MERPPIMVMTTFNPISSRSLACLLAGSVWVPDVTDQTCKPTEPTNQPDSGERMFAQLTGTFLFRILATRLYRVPSARSSIFKSISRYSIWER